MQKPIHIDLIAEYLVKGGMHRGMTSCVEITHGPRMDSPKLEFG